MSKIAILVLLALPGCYGAHAPAPGPAPDAGAALAPDAAPPPEGCRVRWICGEDGRRGDGSPCQWDDLAPGEADPCEVTAWAPVPST